MAPKKRCAHVFVKTASSPSTPAQSGSATPAPAKPVEAAQPDTTTQQPQQQAGDVEMAAPAPSETLAPTEPVVERCKSAALRMVGDCPRCEKSYCGSHRLPEDHACPALANFRKAAFDENRARLEKEATITSKISAF